MTESTLAGVSLVLLFSSAHARAAGEKPVVIGNPAIVLDLQATSGAAPVDLRNDLAEAITLHLSAWPAQDAGQSARVTIKGQPEAATSYELSIKPHTAERIWMMVSAADADDFDIDLLNGAERIAKIPVRHKPFTVHPTDPKAVVNLHQGKAIDIRVTNDDRTAHEITWRLRFDGQDVCQGRVELAPKSPGLLTCTPSFPWSRLVALGTWFRPVTSADATLIMARSGATAAQPPLAIAALPITAEHLNGPVQQFANYLVVLAVLALGGGVSLVLSQVIPNRLSRIALQERLEELQRTISGLGQYTSSSLRVLLRV